MESLQPRNIARQYFKTIFMPSERTMLSRNLLYIGVPAIGSAPAKTSIRGV